MKQQVVSFSGGRTSAYMCKLVKDLHPDTDFIFMDTGAEHPKTYEFIRNVDKEFNLNLTCLRAKFSMEYRVGVTYKEVTIEDIGYDLSIWGDMLEKYSTPYNPSGGFCTDKLKNTVFYKYCNDKYGKGEYDTWIGIRSDETRRAKEKEGVRYLCEISDFDKEDIKDFWSEMPFDLEIESDWLGNCVFCIKRGVNKIALAIKDEPKLAQDFIDLIASDKVRNIPERKCTKYQMYRGQTSLEQIRDMYKDKTREDILSTIRRSKAVDSVCSESCEAIGMSM